MTFINPNLISCNSIATDSLTNDTPPVVVNNLPSDQITTSPPLVILPPTTPFLDSEDNIKAAIQTAAYLKFSKWDLTSYQQMTLSFLIYSKFIEILPNEKELSPKQKEVLFHFWDSLTQDKASFNPDDLAKHAAAMVKEMRQSKHYLFFCCIEKLCQTKKEMFELTVEEILSQKHGSTTEKKLDSSIPSLNIHQKAFFLIETAFCDLMKTIGEENRSAIEVKCGVLQTMGSNGQSIMQQLIFLYNHYSENMEIIWKQVISTKSDKPLIQSLKKQLTHFQTFMIEKIDLLKNNLETTKMSVDQVKNTDDKPILKEILTSLSNQTFDQLLESKRKQLEVDMEKPNLSEEERKQFKQARKGLIFLERKLGKNQQMEFVTNAVQALETQGQTILQSVGGTSNQLSLFQRILKGYTRLSILHLNFVIDSLPERGVNDLSFSAWEFVDLIKPTRKQKPQTKILVEEVLEEEEPIQTEPTQTSLNPFKNLCLSLEKKKLQSITPSSLKVIHEFNLQLKHSFENVFQDWDKVDQQECESHLFLIGYNLDLFIQAMSKDDLESLLQTSSMLFFDMHILFEKLLQQEHIGKYGEMYLESHHLIELLNTLDMGKGLNDSLSDLFKEIDAATLWMRYLREYEHYHPKESTRPKMLNSILFCLDMTQSLQQKPLKIDQKHIDMLKDLTEYLFTTTQKAYDCLFTYSKRFNNKPLPKDMVKGWKSFLSNAKQTIQSHVEGKFGKSIQEKSPKSIKKECGNLLKILESIQNAKSECQLVQAMDFGNPFLPLTEAEAWISRLLSSVKMIEKYPEPLHTSVILRNILGTQFVIEKLLQVRCLCNYVSTPRTHNFTICQDLLLANAQIINPSLQEKIWDKIKTSNKEALAFNIGIGFNYPFAYNKKVEWLEKLKSLLISPKCIETDILNRDEEHIDYLNSAMKQAVDIIKTQVELALIDLRKAQESMKSL